MSTISIAQPISSRAVGRTGLGLIAAALSLAGAVLTLDRFHHGSVSPSAAVTLHVTWLVATVASAAILTSGASRFTRAIDIRQATLVYFLLCFGVLSIEWRHQLSGTSGIIDQESIPAGLLICQAGVIAWALGFRFLQLSLLSNLLASARSIAAPTGPWRLRSPYIAILLYLASAASTAYSLKSGTFAYLANPDTLVSSPGSLGPILELGDQLGKAAIVVAAIGVLTDERYRLRAVAVFTVVTAAELGIGAFSGTKYPFILLAVAVALPFFATRRRVSWKIVAASVAVLAVGTSFTGSYREKLTESGGRLQGQQAMDAFTTTAFETLQPVALARAVGDGTVSLGSRLRQIDNVAVVAQRTPSQIPYRGAGRLLLDPAQNMVPRVLWPGKPSVTTGLDFSREYYDLPSSVLSSSAITVIGDLYRHGGIVVVIVGMALVGATARLADDHWHPYRDIRLAVLYGTIFLTLVNLESDVASVITSVPVAIISGLLASKVAFTRSVSLEP